jgi:hypothetical protein
MHETKLLQTICKDGWPTHSVLFINRLPSFTPHAWSLVFFTIATRAFLFRFENNILVSASLNESKRSTLGSDHSFSIRSSPRGAARDARVAGWIKSNTLRVLDSRFRERNRA